MTRIGWQPALTAVTTERPGSVSARRMLMTCSVPWPPSPPRPDGRAPGANSLVAYSHWPSGDTAIPTGSGPTGMSPMKSGGPNPLASARCRRYTAIAWPPSMLANAYRSSADSATSMARSPLLVSIPSTACGRPLSAAATSMTSAPPAIRDEQVAPVAGQCLAERGAMPGQPDGPDQRRGGLAAGPQHPDREAQRHERPAPVGADDHPERAPRHGLQRGSGRAQRASVRRRRGASGRCTSPGDPDGGRPGRDTGRGRRRGSVAARCHLRSRTCGAAGRQHDGRRR